MAFYIPIKLRKFTLIPSKQLHLAAKVHIRHQQNPIREKAEKHVDFHSHQQPERTITELKPANSADYSAAKVHIRNGGEANVNPSENDIIQPCKT